jgi:hypothetical protein
MDMVPDFSFGTYANGLAKDGHGISSANERSPLSRIGAGVLEANRLPMHGA